jgi:hypothetical protein
MKKNHIHFYITIILFFAISFSVFAQNNAYVLCFNGTSDYVTYASDVTLGRINGASNFVLEAWVYIPTGASSGSVFFTRGEQFSVYLETNNRLAFDEYDGNVWTSFYSNDNVLTNDEWHHIAVIRNTSFAHYVRLYVDGNDVTATVGNGHFFVTRSTALYIGKNTLASGYFNGSIDELRIYSGSKTISDLHTSRNDAPYTSSGSLAALFHFDEGTGSTTLNSASGNNGNLVGPPVWREWNYDPDNSLPFDEFFYLSGEMNNWKGRVMTYNDLTTPTWKATIQSDGTDATSEFKFRDSDENWTNSWGHGTSVTLNAPSKTCYSSGSNGSFSETINLYYTFVFKDITAGSNSDAAIFETTNFPVTIDTVKDNYSGAGNDVTVTITASGLKSTQEHIFVRYTTDAWATSSFAEASYTGTKTDYEATIPGSDVTGDDSQNRYYVLTTGLTSTSITHSNADINTINYSNMHGLNYPLPVELTSFKVKPKGNNVMLNWQTATEINNYGFEVQRTELNTKHSAWKTIGFVEGAGNSNSPKTYSFSDYINQSGKYFYRLKQIDWDGAFKYSETIEINIDILNEFKLTQNYPNPFNITTTISYSIPNSIVAAKNEVKKQTVDVILCVYNTLGQKVAVLVNEKETHGSYTVRFDASNLPSGIYFYTLRTGNLIATKKMILMK